MALECGESILPFSVDIDAALIFRDALIHYREFMMTENEQTWLVSRYFPLGIFSRDAYLQNMHHHIEHEFFYLETGTAILELRNNVAEIHEGDIVFIEAGAEHCLRPAEGEFHYYALVFASSILGNELDPVYRAFESIKINTFLTVGEDIKNRLKHTAQLEKEKTFGRKLFLKSMLLDLLSYILDSKQYQIFSSLHENSRHSVSAVDTVIAYIKKHYREDIDAEDIFNSTNYSKSHFSRLFKEATGKSVTEYINGYRVEKACLDMIYTDKNITEVAMENGFNNVQYFSRVFKKIMKCSPRFYKKNARNVMVPSSFASVN